MNKVGREWKSLRTANVMFVTLKIKAFNNKLI